MIEPCGITAYSGLSFGFSSYMSHMPLYGGQHLCMGSGIDVRYMHHIEGLETAHGAAIHALCTYGTIAD